MVKGGKTISVDKAKYHNFVTVGKNFYEGAEVAKEFEYWNAAGVLIVHTAIAYADAVAIKFGGVKSRGENHQEAVDLINNLVASSEDKKVALTQLRKIIDHKNTVSYSGELYGKKDVDQLWKLVKRFRDWALTVLET